jgi:hypothetical protein
MFASNSVKTTREDVKKKSQTQLVLTQSNDLSADYLLAGHSSHCSHRSHSSHSSHSSHYSCC